MNVLHAVGRLTRDAELKFTAEGKPVVNFSLAVDCGWGASKSTVYYGCSLWRNPESVHPYLKKGKQIGISGEPNLRLWEKAEKHGAEITVNLSEVTLLGNKGEAEAPAEKADGFRKPVTADDFADDPIPF